MTEPQEHVELTEPHVTDVPEPDQEPDDDEAEATENEDQPSSDQPKEAPEAEGVTPEQWEKRFQVAERRFKTYTDAVTKAWEEDALTLVPFNLDPAAPPGFIDTRNKGHVEDDTKAAALAFLGFDGESEMKPDPYSHLCETCDGYGLTLTGSKVQNQDTRRCLDCNGVGYIPEGAEAAPGNGVVSFAGGETDDTRVPAAVGVESPEVQSLRLQGYTIIPPMRTEG